jgi:hypothetical protein
MVFLLSNEQKAENARPSHVYVSLYQLDDQCYLGDQQ